MFKRKAVLEIETKKGVHRYECDATTPLTDTIEALSQMKKDVEEKLSQLEESAKKIHQ